MLSLDLLIVVVFNDLVTVWFISAKKDEPEWLTEWRLKAYRHWLTMTPPDWAKLQIALAKGRKNHDKRDVAKDRDWKREQGRLLRDKG